MTTRAFALVTLLSPALLIVGFVQAARIWPGEARYNIALVLMAGVLLGVGWLNADEPRRRGRCDSSPMRLRA
jgi:hypothetical protein